MSIEQLIITALVGVLSALAGVWSSRGQVANQVSEAWQKFNAPLQAEVCALRERIQTYERGIEILIRQIVRDGGVPLWQPGQELPAKELDTKPVKQYRKNTGSLIQ